MRLAVERGKILQIMRPEREATFPSLRCALCTGESAEPVFRKEGYEIVRCSACGLMYVANPPTDFEISAMYSFACGYHRELADRESAASAKFARAARRYLRLIGKYRDSGRILDVGCSAGIFLDTARKNGWDTYGVEISQDAAEVARSRGLNVVTGTLADANLPRGFFDVVTFWDVLEHVRNPVATLALARDLLGSRGILALATPNVDGVFPRLSLHAAELTGVWRHPEPPHHLVQFSKKTIKHALELAGFQILQVIDRRIPLGHTFGTVGHVLRSPKRSAYAAAFAPVAFIGPLLKSGDSIDVIARKVSPE